MTNSPQQLEADDALTFFFDETRNELDNELKSYPGRVEIADKEEREMLQAIQKDLRNNDPNSDYIQKRLGSFSLAFFFGMPLREQGAPWAERENEVVGCGDVGICTYSYLFSDQSASFFDPTRCSFSICFQ